MQSGYEIIWNLFKETGDNYVFTTKVNYPNNSDLVKQKIYFDKKLNPVKVEVLNENDDVLIKMTFKKVDLNAEFKDKYFSLSNPIFILSFAPFF